MQKAKSSIARDIFSVFSTKIFVLVLSLFSSIILARALGAEGRGVLAAALIYPQLLISITEGGMRQAATFFIGQKKASDSDILGALFSYIIAAGFAGAVAVYSLMLWFGPEYFDKMMMLVVATILPTTLAVNALKGVFLGKQKIAQFNKVLWIQKLLFVASIMVLYWFDLLTVFNAILVTTFASLFNFSQALMYLAKDKLVKCTFSIGVLKAMLKIGVVYAFALFLIDANYKIDILLLGWLSVPEQIGNYVVAVQIGEISWQLPAAATAILMSKSANSIGSDIVHTVCKTTRITLAITLVILSGILLISYYLIEPFYGADYSGSFNMLLLLAPGLLFATVFKSLNSFFAGQGQPHIYLIVIAVAVLVNVVLNIIFIPNYQALGAAVASTISYFVSSFLILIVFCSREKLNFTDVLFIKRSDLSDLINKLKYK